MTDIWFVIFKNGIYSGQKGFSEAGEQDSQEVSVVEENNRAEGWNDYWNNMPRISLAFFD